MVSAGQPGEGRRDRDLEEKLEPVQVWLALAEEKLEVARELLDLSRLDDAVSKAYYVMFYSANAALLAVDVDLHRHASVVSQFGQHFVKAGYADKQYSRILARAMQAREASDYDPRTRASHQDAEQGIADAEAFLEKAKEILEEMLGEAT
jgi:uncharacterized protein (UPF0332 family)